MGDYVEFEHIAALKTCIAGAIQAIDAPWHLAREALSLAVGSSAVGRSYALLACIIEARQARSLALGQVGYGLTGSVVDCKANSA